MLSIKAASPSSFLSSQLLPFIFSSYFLQYSSSFTHVFIKSRQDTHTNFTLYGIIIYQPITTLLLRTSILSNIPFHSIYDFHPRSLMIMQTQSHLNNTRKGEYGFLKLRGRENEVSWDDFITITLYHRVNKLPASGSSSCETSESDDASSVSSTSDTSGSGTPIANVLPVKAPGFHVYVPIRTQTLILTRLQAILEHACFSFAQEAMPDILEETQWSCPEAGELNAWAFYFKKRWEILQQLSRCQEWPHPHLFSLLSQTNLTYCCSPTAHHNGPPVHVDESCHQLLHLP